MPVDDDAMAQRTGRAVIKAILASATAEPVPRSTMNEFALFGLPEDRVPRPPDETLDLLLLLGGAKSLALFHGPERDLASHAAWLEARGFSVALSPFQFVPRTSDRSAGYSNAMDSVVEVSVGSNGWRALVVGRLPEQVATAWLSLRFGWDTTLGRLLGYPECCTASFERRWPDAYARYSGDVAIAALFEPGMPGLSHAPWEANIFGRYLGVELVSHFPCTLGCEETLRTARRHFAVLRHYAPERAQHVASMLRSPALITAEGDVALLTGGAVISAQDGPVITFDPASVIATHTTGPLACALAESGGSVHQDRTEWRIGDSRFHARAVVFAEGEIEPGVAA